MPQLLRSGTIHRVRSSQELLTLGFMGLSRPSTAIVDGDRTHAAEIGLIGSAAELAVTACLYQVSGPKAVVKRDGRYPTGPEALSEFRRLLREKPARVATLTAGVGDEDGHLKALLAATLGFTALFTARAGGLHSGRRYARSVAYHAGLQVVDFLKLLSASRKWAPYLQEVPQVEPMPEKDVVLTAELARLKSASSPLQTADALGSVFLILPEVCRDEPEWLSALQKVNVSPRKRDLSILLASLETAHVGEVVKAAKGARGMPVRITGEEGALTAAIVNLKKSLRDPHERWRAQIATANGCLDDKGYLSLPPIDSVYEYFALGLENMGFPVGDLEKGLTAPDVWPSVAAALSYQGTPGPCFFLIASFRKTEVAQLGALMKRACGIRASLATKWASYAPVFDVLGHKVRAHGALSARMPRLSQMTNARAARREDVLDGLLVRSDQWSRFDIDRMSGVLDALEDPESLEPAFAHLLEVSAEPSPPQCIVSVGRALIHAATDREDLAPMLELVSRPAFAALRTDMRKAMQEVDCLLNVPTAGRHVQDD